ncbi:hypothetical protein HDU78_004984 [Chytriomyces hyalinus]|nr:hypothetical protein HDU78_004984 [Chytriomyces hyalinus]
MSAEDNLQQQLACAYEELEQKEKDLIMAAEFGQQLLHSNALLHARLDAIAAKSDTGDDADNVLDDLAALKLRLHETETLAERQVQALTNQVSVLTEKLATANAALRKSETESAKAVRALELDLRGLKAELDAKSCAFVSPNRRSSSSEIVRAKDVKVSVEEQLLDRENAVKVLAAWKKEAENTMKETALALQENLVKNAELEIQLQSNQTEFDRRGNLIQELNQQVEELRGQLLELRSEDGTFHAPVSPARSMQNANSSTDRASDSPRLTTKWSRFFDVGSFSAKGQSAAANNGATVTVGQTPQPKSLIEEMQRMEIKAEEDRHKSHDSELKLQDALLKAEDAKLKAQAAQLKAQEAKVKRQEAFQKLKIEMDGMMGSMVGGIGKVSSVVASSLNGVTVPPSLMGTFSAESNVAGKNATKLPVIEVVPINLARPGTRKQKSPPVAYSHILSEYY